MVSPPRRSAIPSRRPVSVHRPRCARRSRPARRARAAWVAASRSREQGTAPAPRPACSADRPGRPVHPSQVDDHAALAHDVARESCVLHRERRSPGHGHGRTRSRRRARHRTRRSRRRLQGLRGRRLLLLRFGQRGRAGHPRRCRRDQLLDLRWYRPFTDPVELAFFDAYAAGVFVAASAGNDGPGAATANHLSPWVTTVAASTQQRAFESTLTVQGGGQTFTATGASITAGARALRWSGPVTLPTARCAATRRRRPVPSPARSSPASGAATPGSTRVSMCARRRRRDGALQPDLGRHRDRQPLAANGSPGRRHPVRRVPESPSRCHRQLHRRCRGDRSG